MTSFCQAAITRGTGQAHERRFHGNEIVNQERKTMFPGGVFQRPGLKRGLTILLFLAPALAVMGVFLVYPIFDCFTLSISRWGGYGVPRRLWADGGRWFDNFRAVWNDPYLWTALKNNLIFTTVSTVGTVGLGFVLALALESRIRGWKFFRLAWYLPVTFAFVVVAMLWWRIYDTSGLLNKTIAAVPWLESFAEGLGWRAHFHWLRAPLGMYCIAVVAIWQYSGFPMMVILSAMDDIPPELYEAARIDGAGAWKRVWHITIPSIKETLIAIALIQVIFSFRVFDLVYAITNDWDLQVIASYMYMVQNRGEEAYGLSAAVGVIMLAVGFALALGYVFVVRAQQRKEAFA